jgi:hypothetical protein
MDIRPGAWLVQFALLSTIGSLAGPAGIVRALFVLVLVCLAAPAFALRAVASATIVVPVVVSPAQPSLVVSVSTVDAGGQALVTVAFN